MLRCALDEVQFCCTRKIDSGPLPLVTKMEHVLFIRCKVEFFKSVVTNDMVRVSLPYGCKVAV